MNNVLKVAAALEHQLQKKTYNLSSTFLKDFNSRTGFVPFNNAKDLSGIALVDTTMDPPIRILSYEHQDFDQSYLRMIFIKHHYHHIIFIFRHSIDDAIRYREEMSKLGKLDISKNAAYRLINETGDGLPGLIAEVFGDYLQITTHSEFWSNHINFVSEYLLKQTGKKGVYWKTKFKSGHPVCKHYMGDAVKRKDGFFDLVVEENGMKVQIDLNDIASTGLFLDQRSNRQYVKSLFDGRDSGSILNTFSHTCSFSLIPALHGTKISSYNIDNSRQYHKIAKKNFELNDVDVNFHRFIEKDVFSKLLEMKNKSLGFDVIILDPPTMARGYKFGVFTTKNRYRELLDMALPLLNEGGYVVSFVNTRQVREEQWLRQLGVEDYMAEEGDNNNNSNNKKKEIPTKKTEEQLEFEKLNIETAKFSDQTRIAKHTSSVLPFVKLKGFKNLQSLEQDVDFRWRVGDERVGKHLKGVVLKHKVDYHQSKYKTSPFQSN
ncbi:hypothetical protein PPL_09870 [Heterostelium album PN500]|uniref:S-adenosylmethionine-dependent methyltransferase domain-containing protein n=1 Tax=Heterostelium pallidum (strain ATCC 26659 / Pp 5 / PN500) TaxID=670386 RepID=D3BPA7_HETP5|nr:hypothetical protein PPL_09870 [Heterostelium album PN500]EFA77117.1 hypothetical protein PPL_09870 [Heterostelium album PN500]|eukprot:XP_020429246.1 hypothetical protein PPL_09870 [Heterostelium album PN500]